MLDTAIFVYRFQWNLSISSNKTWMLVIRRGWWLPNGSQLLLSVLLWIAKIIFLSSLLIKAYLHSGTKRQDGDKYSGNLAKDHLDQETTVLLKLFTSPVNSFFYIVQEPRSDLFFGFPNFSNPKIEVRTIKYHIWQSLNGEQYVQMHGPNGTELSILLPAARFHLLFRLWWILTLCRMP